MNIEDTLKIHIAVALKTAPKATRAGLSGKRWTETEPAIDAIATRLAEALTTAFDIKARDWRAGPGYMAGLKESEPAPDE
tara:strand:- start:71 stop:310 length:240 start_codon:yes stop_codon:yes gene_type:complete